MKNLIYRYLFVLASSVVLFSCQKDPMQDIKDGDWNNERNILSIQMTNQFNAVVTRDEFGQKINVMANLDGVDKSAVGIEDLVLSVGATSNVGVGQTLNFNNDENKAQITITSAAGESLTWDVFIEHYDMFYKGNWSIESEVIYVDQEWGSKFDVPIQEPFPNAAPELDNTIEIVFEKFENGRTKGILVNNAGADGAYGVYANDDVDITSKIRHLIPAGESNWEMDVATGKMYISQGGTTSEAEVIKTETGTLLKFTLPYKPEDPYWNYGAHDNYLSWSYQFDINLIK